MEPTGRFDWDDENREHVARHGVRAEEVEEMFRRPRFTQRSRRGTYVTYGRSAEGRLLFAAWARRSGGALRVITARPMREDERKRFRKEVP